MEMREGLRNTFELQLQLGDPDCWYAFTVRLEAFGSRKACRFDCQKVVPRCFEAQGGVSGGSVINFENPYLSYPSHGRLLEEPGVMDVIKLNQKFRAHRPLHSVLNGLIMCRSTHDNPPQELVLAYHTSLAEPLFNMIRGDCDLAERHGAACAADEAVAVARYIHERF